MAKELTVLINEEVAGVVTQDKSGRLQFSYAETWLDRQSAIPLSLSMPLANPLHGDDAIRPYLWGLLPDGEGTLNAWGQRFGVSPRNPFALIQHVGEDLQGAVQMVPADKLEAIHARGGATRLNAKQLEKGFAALMRHPASTQFALGGGQFSLAGAQPKKALYRVTGRWYEPRGRTPSTHILKPSIPNLAGQVENEAFCLRLAHQLDLVAPPIWIERFGDLSVVVVERFDRMRMDGARRLELDQAGGKVRRVHQEDCCQALKVMPQTKYQNEGGPGIKAVMALLSGSSKPGVDRDRFMRAHAYNFVIGGSDAHGKNFGLLIGEGGRFRLAPLYDVISLLPYIKDRKSARLAMSIGGHYRFDQILPRHWEAEARACGFSGDRALAHVRDILARLPNEAPALIAVFKDEGTHSAELDSLLKMLVERVNGLVSVYGREVMPSSDQEA
jgi:serine/threonine-protein kinase HipA